MCNHVHLHVHSEYSLLDGLSKTSELIERAKSLGAAALAITDHGVCGAIPGFIRECIAAGIKPIAGCELYTTKDRLKKGDFLKQKREAMAARFYIKENALKAFIRHIERHPNDFLDHARLLLKDHLMLKVECADEELIAFREIIYDYLQYDNYHLVVLAVNQQGLEDLYEIVTDAHLCGFYNDPRTDLAFIASRGLGKHLIATSACLGSYFSRLALAGRIEEAKAWIQSCKTIFHSFYLEKQATRLPEQLALNAIIDQLSIETNTAVIVTTDVHYANQNDHEAHDVLVAMSTGKCITDEQRMKYPHEFWMKSEDEILEIVNDPIAIENTKQIAEQIEWIKPQELLFPRFIHEGNESVEMLFERLCWSGLFELSMQKAIPIETYAKQLRHEIEVIRSAGFCDYFLIVSDFIRWAKGQGYLVGPGRGSAAGSLVSYCLKITALDPMEWNLLFERFLNPERVEFPDIDIDFGYETASMVQEYLKQKYGTDHVAPIGTYGTLAAKSAIRMVGKTLGYSLSLQDSFAKSISNKPGVRLADSYLDPEFPEVKQYADQYPLWWKMACMLEGHVRTEGVHAGGIVISPKPLTKSVPLRLDKKGMPTTQFDKDEIGELLVKFDILKLDTLDLMEKTMQSACIQGKIDLNDIDLNDPKIYQSVYQAMHLGGIFQVESDGMRNLIEEMKPSSIQDISVIIALFRPGPMDMIPVYIRRKFGLEKVSYPFDELKSVLESTYGIFCYQEQIMQSSMILGGFTKGQSDILRKAVGKKKHDLMEEWIGYMIYGNEALGIQGGIKRGFDEQKLLKLKEDWIKFGDYAFNYAHTAAYAMLSVQTAWLKTYYPTEFMAALLTISQDKKKDDDPKTVTYIRECEQMGIEILPPDINESGVDWTPIASNKEEKTGFVRYGLGGIANISSEAIQEIIRKRPYQALDDFVQKVEGRKVNKSKVIALIKSGCFDFFDRNRNALLKKYFEIRGEKEINISTQTSKKDIMEMEIEYLGMPISVKSRWSSIPDGKEGIQLTGIVDHFQILRSKKGHRYAHLMLSTAEDTRKIIIFDYLLKQIDPIETGFKLTIKGKKSKEDLIASHVCVSK